MVATSLLKGRVSSRSALVVRHDTLRLRTRESMQFIDMTERIRECVRASGIWNGTVNVQTRHTTTGIAVNENEPLLLADMKRALEAAAPSHTIYEHDDMERRQGPLPPDEPINGHSHCKALFMRASETLNIVEGRLDLGQWQSIFFVELCSARERTVSLMFMGEEA